MEPQSETTRSIVHHSTDSIGKARDALPSPEIMG